MSGIGNRDEGQETRYKREETRDKIQERRVSSSEIGLRVWGEELAVSG